MSFKAVIAGLAVPAVLIGGVAVLEASAHNELTQELTTRVEKSVPDSHVVGMNVRGRPYLVSRNQHRISTAYVDVEPGGEAARTQLLVQELNLDTDQTHRIRVFVTFDRPEGMEPVRNADGSFSRKGSLNGKEISFSSTSDGTSVTVTGEGLGTVGTASLPKLKGLELTDTPYVTDDGILVSLAVTNVQLSD